MINSGLFSSVTDLWETPQWLMDDLGQVFSFVLDVCALPRNAKAPLFFSPLDDGLGQDWQACAIPLVEAFYRDNPARIAALWMNPPYGREIGRWVEKAYLESLKGLTVVCLLPSRTDTRWFQRYVSRARVVTFLPGRIKFSGAANSAPFPSVLVVFGHLDTVASRKLMELGLYVPLANP